jgi:hypothetical protein
MLRDWWDRLRGASDVPPRAKAPARPVRPVLPAQSGDELQLQDGPHEGQPSRPGTVGFDPYGNDAGFAKPHGWDRGDHR